MKKLTLSIIAVALLVLVTLGATPTAPATASNCVGGRLYYTGDYDLWKLRVWPGYWYTVTLVGPLNADFDLYVLGKCSSTSSGSIESCSFRAFGSHYKIKVKSFRGSGPYILCVR